MYTRGDERGGGRGWTGESGGERRGGTLYNSHTIPGEKPEEHTFEPDHECDDMTNEAVCEGANSLSASLSLWVPLEECPRAPFLSPLSLSISISTALPLPFTLGLG